MDWPSFFAETFARPCSLETVQFGGDEVIVRGRSAYYAKGRGEPVRPAETIDHPWYLWNATGVNMSVQACAVPVSESPIPSRHGGGCSKPQPSSIPCTKVQPDAKSVPLDIVNPSPPT